MDNVLKYKVLAKRLFLVMATVLVCGLFAQNVLAIVQQPVLSGIAITTPATKLSYFTGESLNLTGLVVTGTYTCIDLNVTGDGEETIVPVKCLTADGEEASEIYKIEEAFNVSGFNSTTVGTKTLTVAVGSKTATYGIVVAIGPTPTPTPTPTPAPTSGGGGGGGYYTSTSASKAGDVNNDSAINEYDFAIMMAQWGQTESGLSADLNKDGVVDEYDFALLMANWGL